MANGFSLETHASNCSKKKKKTHMQARHGDNIVSYVIKIFKTKMQLSLSRTCLLFFFFVDHDHPPPHSTFFFAHSMIRSLMISTEKANKCCLILVKIMFSYFLNRL